MRKLVLFMIMLPLVLTSCGKKEADNPTTEVKEQKVLVHVVPVVEQEIRSAVLITGEAAPAKKVTVYPRAAGLVVKEFVKNGDRVRKDQVLAEIKQDIPGMKYANVKIEATVSGKITMDFLHEGGRVTPQSPAYEISQLNPIEVNFSLPERYLSFARVGQTMEIEFDAFPGEKFAGKITEISPQIDPRSRMGTIKVKIDNQQQRVLPGMFARANFYLNSHKGLTVPLDAVVKSGVDRYVFVIRQGIAHQVKIQTGEFLDSHVEVNGDLQAGDTVVVMGQNKLSDGSSVKIVEED